MIQIKNTVAPGHLGPEGLETDVMAQRSVVVVVDDDPSLLKSVARLLAHHGIDSRTFASAEALLESDCFEAATCLLLDINLGGISGIELQRRLVASGSKLPTILMTANDDEATRNEAMDARCIAYLRKPFAQHVLLDASSKAAAEPSQPKYARWSIAFWTISAVSAIPSRTRCSEDWRDPSPLQWPIRGRPCRPVAWHCRARWLRRPDGGWSLPRTHALRPKAGIRQA